MTAHGAPPVAPRLGQAGCTGYVATDDAIVKLDLNTNTVAARLDVTTPAPPAIAVAPDQSAAYVGGSTDFPPAGFFRGVLPVTLPGGTPQAVVPAPGSVEDVVLNPAGTIFFVAIFIPGEVQAFSTAAGHPLLFTLATSGVPLSLAVTPDGTRLIIGEADGIQIVDLATNTVGTLVPIAGGARDVAASNVTAVAVNSTSVVAVDIATGSVGTPIPAGLNAQEIAITSDGSSAYVVNNLNPLGPMLPNPPSTVSPVDLRTLMPGTPIVLSPTPGHALEANALAVVCTSAPPAPTFSTAATPSTVVGGPIRDTSTLAGAGPAPMGTVTFGLYRSVPGDAVCLGVPVFTSTLTVTGNGTYTSTPKFTPTQPGTFQWLAAYSGDNAHAAVVGVCGAPGEVSQVLAPTYSCSPATNVTSTTAILHGATTDVTATSATFTLTPPAGTIPPGSAPGFLATASGLTPATRYSYTVTFNPGSHGLTGAACNFTTPAAVTTPTPAPSPPPTTVPPPAPPAPAPPVPSTGTGGPGAAPLVGVVLFSLGAFGLLARRLFPQALRGGSKRRPV
ncbi:MAG: hypothetical protein ACR2GX_03145 [Candidatus Dormibacteria bacterium]